ncbi:small-subunit processome [Lipomyces chichibuensis]|uniref:small-subunit processome n=1 Tax=Lipomyces chichibuensis TaxID=1546026 RepID=UPI0033433032
MVTVNKSDAKRPDVVAKKKLENALRQVEVAENVDNSDSEDSFLGVPDDDVDERSDGEDDVDLDIVDESRVLASGDGEDDSDDKDEPDDDETPSFSGVSDTEGSTHLTTATFSDIESDSVPSDLEEEEDDAMKSLQKAIEKASQKPAEDVITIRKRRKLGLPTHFAPTVDDSEDVMPAKKKVTLDDIRAHTSSSFGTRSLARLDELEKRSKGKSEVVKSRLGRRLEVRVDRAAAYEIAKEEVGKWEDTVKRNREAEHLEFPLQRSDGAATADITGALDLGDELDGEKLVHGLEGREFSLAEVAARRNELRRMRELMFREEMKAKRVKRIKSKTYRKIHKRERERAQEIAAQLEGESGDENNEGSYERLVKRARERMELRHKNTSDWARDVKRMNLHKSKGTRDELEQMLRRGEDLVRKIEGDDNEISGDDLPSINDDEEATDEASGIMAMKFMREAEERLRKRNKESIDELRRMEDGLDGETEQEDTDSAVKIINEGRRRYAPGAQKSKEAAEESVEQSNQEDDAPVPLERKMASIAVKDAGPASTISKKLMSKKGEPRNDGPKSSKTSNPWMLDVEPGSVAKGASVLSLSKESTRFAKTEAKLKRSLKKAKKAVQAVGDGEAEVRIDINQILQVRDVHGDPDAGPNFVNVEDSHVMMVHKGGRRAKPAEFQQRELVKRAFAGDDVVREFNEEKQRTVEDEGDKEVDVTLPGWGSWTGKGVRKPQKKFIQKIEGINPKNRQDAKLKNVIINEKAVKKSAKYTAGAVPFPYETREQYERSLRMPIGKQWSTQTTVQRLTKPKVIVKPGVVVEPLSAPFAT